MGCLCASRLCVGLPAASCGVQRSSLRHQNPTSDWCRGEQIQSRRASAYNQTRMMPPLLADSNCCVPIALYRSRSGCQCTCLQCLLAFLFACCLHHTRNAAEDDNVDVRDSGFQQVGCCMPLGDVM